MTAFSQRDARWAAQVLGRSEITIGKAGCLMTAACSLLADWGKAISPGALNRWLIRHGGYARAQAGGPANLFVFDSIAPLGARLVKLVNCRYVPAPMVELREALREGYGLLLCVDYTPGGPFNVHWVRALELTEHGGRVMDPWQPPGHEEQQLARFLAPGWTVGRGIFRAAVYQRTAAADAPGVPESRAAEIQDVLCLRPEGSDGGC